MAKARFKKGDRVHADGQRGVVVDPDTTLDAHTPDSHPINDLDGLGHELRRVLIKIDDAPGGADQGQRLVYEDRVEKDPGPDKPIPGEVVANG